MIVATYDRGTITFSGRSTYDYREVIKAYGASWDSGSKTWSVPQVFAAGVVEALRAAGATVTVVNNTPPPPPRPRAAAASSGWAVELMNRCEAVDHDLAQRVFRALTMALHPDVGGDTKLTQELLAARPVQARAA